MLTLISPAKTLDFETPWKLKNISQPEFLHDSQLLIDQLRKLPAAKIGELMSISEKLAILNVGRFLNWHLPFTNENAKPAILAFRGDVYTGLEADSFSTKDFNFAQKHLRILSGLYGVLRPLDLIQAYRLEMGTGFQNSRGKNLYEFWGDKVTENLNAELSFLKKPVLVNLASNEYWSVVKPAKLQAEIITPIFKDQKTGQYKIISFFAKKARGMMSAFMIKNQINKVNDLKEFNADGYQFNAKMSKGNEWVFTRETAE
jgi:cytoplasmic iron level regulating protein YaaA (DUF328/UPF0246 family)